MLRDLLRGFAACPPETVGNMTMAPLVAQATECQTVGDTRDLYLEQDVTYETVVMATRSPHVTIIPQGLVLITKERAQDRAFPSAHIVSDKRTCHAFCVQSAQCGLMRRGSDDQREFRLLPAGVRLAALSKREQEVLSLVS